MVAGRGPFFKHEEGFTIGGPFVKDRLFWFGSYEKVAQGSPTTLTPFTVPMTVNTPTNEILGSFKVDARLTDKHTLTVRYNLQRDTNANLLVQTGPNTDPSGLVNTVVHDNTLNVGMISSLTPHVINEARFFWHRFLSQTPDARNLPGSSLPNAYVGADFCRPQSALQHRFQFVDNVSWTRGIHTFKFGTNISHFKPVAFFGRVHPISPTIRNPEIHMASMSYQRPIGSSFVFSLGYQGVFGHGLFGGTDTNFPTPVADPNHPGFFYFQAIPGSSNDRPNGAFGAIRTNFSDRTSGYNALVVTAEKRLAHHFQFTSSYTWSHTISNGEDIFGLSEPANPLTSLNTETASSLEDIRHLANFNFIADSNNLVHAPILNHIVNNWTFGLLGTLQSGRPYPISTGDRVCWGQLPGTRRRDKPAAEYLRVRHHDSGLRWAAGWYARDDEHRLHVGLQICGEQRGHRRL